VKKAQRWRLLPPNLVESVPEHLMHCIMVQSVAIIHEGEAQFFFYHSLIHPELFGADIRIIGIVYQKNQRLKKQ